MKTSCRWSRQELRPSRTDWEARFISSSRTQPPDCIACRRGPSRQANLPTCSFSIGTSAPKRSIRSVWSDKLMRVKCFPTACARAVTIAVFPTPGLPSRRTGLCIFRARTSRIVFLIVAGASKTSSRVLFRASDRPISNTPTLRHCELIANDKLSS